MGGRESSARFSALVAVATAVSILLMACPAAAEGIIYVNASATGAGDGSSWADAYTTVSAGLDAAASGDQVWVAAGAYVGCIMLKAGVALYGGVAGTEDATSFDLADRDLAANQTVLDGDEAGSVVTAPEGATQTTLIDGFIITNGRANRGGGIYCYASSPTIDNCCISNNNTANDGGGIYCGGSSPTISNCTITGNTASGSSSAYGGGIYCSSSSPTISNCTITKNAASHYGGGIYCQGWSSPTINNCIISDNAVGGDGGGICCWDSSSPTISNCTIAGNAASLWADGICYAYSYPPAISNCIVWNLSSKLVATYSCILGGAEGEGNISAYPYFADPDNGDYRLLPWSPCINAGSNESVAEDFDLAGNARIQEGVVDMGAYESSYPPSPDIDGDGLPDLWEIEQFGDLSANAEGDPDGDRLSNLREYELGTNPLGAVAYVSAANSDDPDADGSIEHPFPSIQQAMDAKVDAIYVAGGVGVYQESIRIEEWTVTLEGGYSPDFSAREVLANETVIHAPGTESAVTLAGSNGGILDGFTITNGEAYRGGGIYCDASSPTIRNCTITGNTVLWYGGGIYSTPGSFLTINNCTITNNTGGNDGGGIRSSGRSLAISNCTITGNSAGAGGGIFSNGSDLTISNCTISGNSAAAGGGVYCHSSYQNIGPTVTNCIITGNIAADDGGGIYCTPYLTVSPTISNCTIIGNISGGKGGGIYCDSYYSPTITNCILWNTGGELEGCTAIYSCIRGGGEGEGNIDAEPLFADAENGDFHLKSRYGRWSPSANDGMGGYLFDTVHSPCIDAGDPECDYSNEPMPNFGRVNMGAYGNTPEASKSGWNIAGDANGDCVVDILDLLFIRNRLNHDSETDDNWLADANADGKINILDMLYVRNRMGTRCPTE